MKSGTKEIQKRMLQQVPRLNMSMKEWVGKAAKYYNCTYLTLENIYYRPNRSIPNEIYIKLTALPRHNPANHPNTEDLRTALNDLRIKLEEKENSIKTLEREFNGTREKYRKIGALLASL